MENHLNHNDYSFTVTVKVIDKNVPVLTVDDITTTYTGQPAPASLIHGTAAYDGAAVEGAWSWSSTAPTNAGTHSVSVTFTPKDTDTYTEATSTITITINKATPAGSPGYTAISASGKTLADAKLTTGSFTVPGAIRWEDDERTEVEANTSYKWVFTPDDTDNYNTVTGSIELWHKSSSSGDSSDSGNKTETEKNPDGSGKTTLTTDNGVAVTLSDGDTVKIVDNTKTFVDVSVGYWGSEYIDFAASRELFAGTGENTFSPDTAMTRAIIVTVLAAYDGADTSSTGGAWYEAGQRWAMVNGISDGTNMEQELTREQLAVMLWSYAGKPDSNYSLTGYPDWTATSSWAAQAMAWAAENGLISNLDGALAPQGTATRAQVATILMRFVEKTV